MRRQFSNENRAARERLRASKTPVNPSSTAFGLYVPQAGNCRPLAARRPPNLMIVGASGHVAQAFMLRLQQRRNEFGSLVLLDQSDRVLKNPYIDHDRLNYEFIQRRLRFPDDAGFYCGCLASRAIDVVLDATDLDTMPILEATDDMGISYVNTALNDARQCVAEIVSLLHPTRAQVRKAPHIISSGMNPGVVNIWVWDGFRRYGAPRRVVHFEYDTSTPISGWRPVITWSRQEFLTESIWEPAGLVVKGKLRMCAGNSLQNRQDMRSVMEPVLPLDEYPQGLLVLHEENVKLGQKLGASSKYLYAIHPRTMDYLERVWRETGTVEIEDLELGDNTSVPLTGADTIGLCLEYDDRRVYYLHSLANEDVVGTNATCAQVAVGIDAALTTLLSERLEPRLYFASDLYDTVYTEVVFKSLRVDRFELERNGDAKRVWRPSEEQKPAQSSLAALCAATK